jgi:hypothetical protein
MDESAYLNYAYVLRSGYLYSDQAGINTVMSYPVGNDAHTITQYPPGQSLLLAVFSLLGWNFALGMNLVLHLLTAFILTRILVKVGCSRWWAILYLLHPTVVLYSRTVMSDIPSALLVTLFFLLYLEKKFLLAGICAGSAVFIRTANGIAIPIAVLAILLEQRALFFPASGSRDGVKIRQTLREIIPLVLSATVFVVVAYLYQKIFQEGGWAKYSQGGQVGLHHLPKKLPMYTIALMTIYPGMLIAPFLYKGPGKFVLNGLCFSILALYSCYHFADVGATPIQTFIMGQRYLITIVPLMLVAYASVLEKKGLRPSNNPWSIIAVAASLLLFAISAFVHRQHDQKLREDLRIRTVVSQSIGSDSYLIGNIHVVKMLHPIWTGIHKWELFTTQEISREDAGNRAVEQVKKALDSGKNVYVAVWSRGDSKGYFAESDSDQWVMEQIATTYNVEKKEFPDLKALNILHVLGKKSVVK